MKIAESSITMSSMRQFTQVAEVQETLAVLVERPSPTADQTALQDRVSLSDESKSLQCGKASRSGFTDAGIRYRHMLKALIVEALTGRKLHVFDPADLQPAASENTVDADTQTNTQEGSGVGILYDRTTRYVETESVSMEASGMIRTEDNREISFSLSMEMSRTFVETTGVHVRAGDPALVDPLVVNFAGTAAELTETRFEFDLDIDGAGDLMPGLRGGSGYLALDRNNDGIINDGSELFGPATGDGFEELAAYDADGNQWIDDKDPVFDKLRIWLVNGNGMGRLEKLRHSNIGAIHLAKLSTLFDHRDDANRLEGRTTDTGLFLREDGTAGTVQQLDLIA